MGRGETDPGHYGGHDRHHERLGPERRTGDVDRILGRVLHLTAPREAVPVLLSKDRKAEPVAARPA